MKNAVKVKKCTDEEQASTNAALYTVHSDFPSNNSHRWAFGWHVIKIGENALSVVLNNDHLKKNKIKTRAFEAVPSDWEESDNDNRRQSQ